MKYLLTALLYSAILHASLHEELSHAKQLIINNDIQAAVHHLDAKVARAVVNCIYEQVYLLEKAAGHPTDHRDFGRMAFQKLEGFDITDSVRLQAIQIIQDSSPAIYTD